MVYSDEEIEWLRQNNSKCTTKELVKRFNKHFKANRTLRGIKGIKIRNGIRLEKNPYKYKKGHIPPKTKPVGSETVNHCGYIMIKVKQPNVWRNKHHVIYEKGTGDKVKKGETVVFLDGDKRNFDLNNLLKISWSTNLSYFTHSRGREKQSKETREIVRSELLVREIEIKTRKLKKEPPMRADINKQA